jgi:hypothetical protein
MITDEWDKDLSRLRQEVHSLVLEVQKQHQTTDQSLILRKIAIIQSQLQTDRNLDHIRGLRAKGALLRPREMTLVHWGKVLADRLAALLQLKCDNLTRDLWLKLIQARMGASSHREAGNIDRDDLIHLALKKSQLAKTEKYLVRALKGIFARKHALNDRYIKLDIARQNRFAAGSMYSRLGINAEDAITSPQMKALRSYFWQILSPLDHSKPQSGNERPSKARQRSSLAAFKGDYGEKSADLSNMAIDMVTDDLKSNSRSRNEEEVLRFQQNLNQLNGLKRDGQALIKR